MANRSRLSLGSLVVAAVVAASTVAVGGVAAAPPGGGDRLTVTDVEFLGEVTFDTGLMFEGTEVGGLSGIVYDAQRDEYHSISDDRSQINPARYYTLSIDLTDGSLDDGDIAFSGVTTLLDSDGAPFAPGAIDPEGIALRTPGQLLVSSEGDANASPPIDPFVRRYNRTGPQTADATVPAKFLPDGVGTSGVRNNLAFESLTTTPDRATLLTATEGALAQDGPVSDVGQDSLGRILEYDARNRRPGPEYVYEIDPVPQVPDPPNAFRVNGLVELLAIDNHGTALALERAFSVGKGNTVRLFEISSTDATDVSGFDDLTDDGSGSPPPFDPVTKELILDVEADLGIEPDNLEGLAFGPPLPDGRLPLIVVSDNNFNPGQVTQFIALAVELSPAS